MIEEEAENRKLMGESGLKDGNLARSSGGCLLCVDQSESRVNLNGNPTHKFAGKL